jgi:glycosidase
MLSLYRRLIDLRRASPALSVGSYRQVFVDDDLLVYSRTSGDRRLLVALNFSHSPRQLPPGMSAGLRPLLSTYLDVADAGVLRPDEGLLLE